MAATGRRLRCQVGGEWLPATEAWRAALWSTPQATIWREDGSTLHALAPLWEGIFAGGEMQLAPNEIRQHEDRHGLSPKAMETLRWRIAPVTPAPTPGAVRPTVRQPRPVRDPKLKVTTPKDALPLPTRR